MARRSRHCPDLRQVRATHPGDANIYIETTGRSSRNGHHRAMMNAFRPTWRPLRPSPGRLSRRCSPQAAAALYQNWFGVWASSGSLPRYGGHSPPRYYGSGRLLAGLGREAAAILTAVNRACDALQSIMIFSTTSLASSLRIPATSERTAELVGNVEVTKLLAPEGPTTVVTERGNSFCSGVVMMNSPEIPLPFTHTGDRSS
jgi:hypothetical protein